MNWHKVLRRHREELICHVYHSTKDRPLKDDWISLSNKDLEKICLSINDEDEKEKKVKEI